MCSPPCWAEIAGVSLAVPLLALVPGTLAAAHLRFLTPDERAAVAGGFGVAFLGSSAFVAHVSGAAPARVNAALWAVAVIAGIASSLAFRRPYWSAASWRLLGLWGLFYLTLLGLQGMSPIYAGGSWYGDWWEHYSIAQVYLGTTTPSTVWFGDYNLASRTPLFNLAAAFALSLFGDRFWVYQITSTFASTLFLLPTFLVASELRGRRVALLAAGFTFFNTWLIHDAMFTWSKMTAACMVLLALHLHLRFRAGAGTPALYLSALFGGLAIMSHQSTSYYVVALAADHWLLRPRTLSRREAIVAGAILAAVVLPWHWWVSRLYGVIGVVKAVPVWSTGTPTLLRVLRGGAENAVTSLLPVPFIDFVRGGPFVREEVLARLVQLYFNSVTGAMTLSLIVAVLAAWRSPSPEFVRGFHRLKGPWLSLALGAVILAAVVISRPRYASRWSGPGPFVWLLGAGLIALGLRTWRRPPADAATGSPHLTAAVFTLAGYWGGLLAHPGGDLDGFAANAMVPSVILVIVYALARVVALPPWAQALFLAGVVVEFAVTWTFLGSLITGGPPFASDPNHGLKLEHGLAFLYDAAGGQWRPFAALALLGQATAVATLWRWRSAAPTDGPRAWPPARPASRTAPAPAR